MGVATTVGCLACSRSPAQNLCPKPKRISENCVANAKLYKLVCIVATGVCFLRRKQTISGILAIWGGNF